MSLARPYECFGAEVTDDDARLPLPLSKTQKRRSRFKKLAVARSARDAGHAANTAVSSDSSMGWKAVEAKIDALNAKFDVAFVGISDDSSYYDAKVGIFGGSDYVCDGHISWLGVGEENTSAPRLNPGAHPFVLSETRQPHGQAEHCAAITIQQYMRRCLKRSRARDEDTSDDKMVLYRLCTPGDKRSFIEQGTCTHIELQVETASLIQSFFRKRLHVSIEDGSQNANQLQLLKEAECKAPQLFQKWSQQMAVVAKLPDDAFSNAEQSRWLSKLCSEHMGYNYLALLVADRLVVSLQEF